MLIKPDWHISQPFQIVEYYCDLIRVHLWDHILISSEQLVCLIAVKKNRLHAFVLVLLRQPFQIELGNILNSELDADLFKDRVVVFVLKSSHQCFNLMTLNDSVMSLDLSRLLSISSYEVISLVSSQQICLSHMPLYSLYLLIALIDFTRNQWVYACSLMNIFLHLLLDLIIELESDIDLGLLLIPEFSWVLSKRSLKLRSMLCWYSLCLECSPSLGLRYLIKVCVCTSRRIGICSWSCGGS